jgi:hypothetical protein
MSTPLPLRDTNARRSRSVVAGVLVVLAGGFGVGLLADDSWTPGVENPQVFEIYVSKPDVQAMAALDGTLLRPNSDSEGTLAMAFDVGDGETLRWLVLMDPDERDPDGPTVEWSGQIEGPTSAAWVASADWAASGERSKGIAAITIYFRPAVFRFRGSDASLTFPRVDLGRFPATTDYLDRQGISTMSRSAAWSGPQGGPWYSPTGQVMQIGPGMLSYYRTEVAAPQPDRSWVWSDRNSLAATWFGTDIAAEAAAERRLYLAGICFGIAGSALVALILESELMFATSRPRPRASA